MTDRPTELCPPRDVLEKLRSMLQAFGGTVWRQDIEAAILEIENLWRAVMRRDLTIDVMMRDLDALQELIARRRG